MNASAANIRAVFTRLPYSEMDKHEAAVRLLTDLRHWCTAERLELRVLLAESAGVWMAEQARDTKGDVGR